jgi:hypothetical protein
MPVSGLTKVFRGLTKEAKKVKLDSKKVPTKTKKTGKKATGEKPELSKKQGSVAKSGAMKAGDEQRKVRARNKSRTNQRKALRSQKAKQKPMAGVSNKKRVSKGTDRPARTKR